MTQDEESPPAAAVAAQDPAVPAPSAEVEGSPDRESSPPEQPATEDNNSGDDDDDNYEIGGWFGKFNQMIFRLCVVSFFVTGIGTGAVTGTLTALEDEFGISTTVLGVIVVMYDVSYVVTSIPVAHFLHGHIPKAIGVGMLLFAGAAVLYGFSTDVGVFIPAQLIMGMGATPVYVMGFVHVDDNTVKKHKSAKHYGKVLAATPVGVVAGLLLTGFFLKDCDSDDDDYCGSGLGNLTGNATMSPEPQDCSKWPYAFWIMAGAVVPFAIWFFFSKAKYIKDKPKRKVANNAPDSDRQEQTRVNPAHPAEGSGLVVALKFLLTHRELVILMLSQGCTGFVGSSLIAFSPRFFERQLCESKGTANMLAAVFVPLVCFAFYLGGKLVEKFRLTIKQQWLVIAVVHFIALPFFLGYYAEKTWLFMCLVSVPIFGLFLPNTTSLNIAKAVVPEHLRAHSMAMMNIAIRTLGAIPGPIVLGALLDSDSISDRGAYVLVATVWTGLGGILAVIGYLLTSSDLELAESETSTVDPVHLTPAPGVHTM